MKNKRLAFFLIIFVFLAIVVVLSSAIFSLDNVQLRFLSTTNLLSNNEKTIIESGNFKYGENVFFSSKSRYIKNLEKSNPYIRVINIETVFPNKLIINAVERNETYVIKMDNNKYAKTDEYLKVLSISNVFQNNANNGIIVFGSEVTDQIANEGDFLKSDNYLTQLFNCFREWDNSYVNLKSKIQSIELNYKNDSSNLMINMRSGVQILIKQCKNNLSDKLNLAYSFYDSSNELDDYTKEGLITVYENGNKIKANYAKI